MGTIQCAKHNRDSNSRERHLSHWSAIYLQHRFSVSARQDAIAGTRSESDGVQGRSFRRQEADVSYTWIIRPANFGESKHGTHIPRGGGDPPGKVSPI